MLRPRDPCETYRRIDFEARVAGSDPLQLVDVCFEQLCGSLDRTLFAATRSDNAMKSAALTALQMGVGPEGPTGLALIQLYGAARRSVLDSAVRFDAGTLRKIRADFEEIRVAMRNSAG